MGAAHRRPHLTDLADAIAELNQSRERLRYAHAVQRAAVRVRTETGRLIEGPDELVVNLGTQSRPVTVAVAASQPAPVEDEALRRARDRHDHRDRPLDR